MPPGTEDLTNSQASYPTPLSGPIPNPTIRRSISKSSTCTSIKAQPRRRSRGVHFLSPQKSTPCKRSENDSSVCLSLQDSSHLDNSETSKGENSNSNSSTMGTDGNRSKSLSMRLEFNVIPDELHQERVAQSENSLQNLSSSRPTPLSLAHVEPGRNCSFKQLKEGDENGKSDVYPALVQTQLTLADRIHKSRPSTTACISTTLRSITKCPTDAKSLPFSLEEPGTCARALPIESLKLGRYGHTKESENLQTCEGVEEMSDCDVGVVCTNRVSCCARLEPVGSVVLSRNGRAEKNRNGDMPILKNGNENRKRVGKIDDNGKSIHETKLVDRMSSALVLASNDSFRELGCMTAARLCERDEEVTNLLSHRGQSGVDTGPSSAESMESEEVPILKLAEAQASVVGRNISLRSSRNSFAFPTAFIKGYRTGSNVHTDQGNQRKTADMANAVTFRPKLGTSEAKDASSLYRKKWSQRSLGSGSSTKIEQLPEYLPLTLQGGSLDTPSSSCSGSQNSRCSLIQAPAPKRLKLNSSERDRTELHVRTQKSSAAAKPRRVLPTYLQPGGSSTSTNHCRQFNRNNIRHSRGDQVEPSVASTCVCGSGEMTRCVSVCRRCHSTIVNLGASGLLGRLSKSDPHSPNVYQVYTNYKSCIQD